MKHFFLLVSLLVMSMLPAMHARNSAVGFSVSDRTSAPDSGGQDENYNILFTITADLGEDEDGYEIDECELTMMLGGKPGQSIAIDYGYGKQDFTFQSDDPATVTEFVDAGATVKIYGDLTLLDVSGNRTVTSIVFGDNPNLQVLRLAQNKITQLDVAGLTALKELSFSDNKVTDIDISHLENLEEYYGAWNNYKVLRTSENRKLTVLTCYNTGICELDLQNNTELQSLVAGGNSYTTPLSLVHNTKLVAVDLEGSNLESVDLSRQPDLRRLNVANNKLTAIDLSSNTSLENVDCRYNLMDACSINDLLFTLPVIMAENEDKPKVWIAGNPGAEDAETDLASWCGWVIDQTGSGKGCDSVRFKLIEPANGTFTVQVADHNYTTSESVAKGTSVELLAAPESGYKLSQFFFNDVELDGTQFVAERYGAITAVFMKDTGITEEGQDSLIVRRISGGFELKGLKSGSVFSVYDVNGRIVDQGIVSPEGSVRVSVEKGLYLCKIGNMIIKLLR